VGRSHVQRDVKSASDHLQAEKLLQVRQEIPGGSHRDFIRYISEGNCRL
jgi:hypothetical protein